jgi:hypothetical protein
MHARDQVYILKSYSAQVTRINNAEAADPKVFTTGSSKVNIV